MASYGFGASSSAPLASIARSLEKASSSKALESRCSEAPLPRVARDSIFLSFAGLTCSVLHMLSKVLIAGEHASNASSVLV